MWMNYWSASRSLKVLGANTFILKFEIRNPKSEFDFVNWQNIKEN